MSCIIKIMYPHPKEAAVQKLKDAVLNQGGSFEGDTRKGHFQVDTPIGFFEAVYEINGDEIILEVLKKPFFISSARIEREIRAYLENHPELHKLKNDLFDERNKGVSYKMMAELLYDNADAIKLQKIIASYIALDYREIDLSIKIENTYISANFKENFCDDICQTWKQLKPSVIFGGMFDSIKTGNDILSLLEP